MASLGTFIILFPQVVKVLSFCVLTGLSGLQEKRILIGIFFEKNKLILKTVTTNRLMKRN